MSIGKGILATTLSCGHSGYNIFLPDFFFRIVNCLGVEGWICHSCHYQKCKEQELDLADSLCERGLQLESVEVSQGFPIHDVFFFKRAQPIIQKSYDGIFRLTNGCQAQQEENGEREESAITCFEFLQMPRVFK